MVREINAVKGHWVAVQGPLVSIATDRDTGEQRGFAFVEMGVDAEAQRAIEMLSGKELNGRALTVNEARPKTDRGSGGGGYRGGGGRQNRW